MNKENWLNEVSKILRVEYEYYFFPLFRRKEWLRLYFGDGLLPEFMPREAVQKDRESGSELLKITEFSRL